MHDSIVRRIGIIVTAVAALLVEDACNRSSAAAAGGTAPAPASASSSRAVITAEQIAAGHFTNAREAIESLRSNWLNQRGTDSFNNPGEIQVYLDNSRVGGIDTLRGIQANAIVSIRFIPGLEAAGRWGLDHGHGVIFISTRARS